MLAEVNCFIKRVHWMLDSILSNYGESVLAKVNRFYKRVHQMLACIVSNCFMTTNLFTCASSYRSILWTRTLKLHLTLLTPLPYLAPYDFFLFPHLKKCFAGWRFNLRSSFESAIFQCLSQIPQIKLKQEFLQLVKRCSKCVAAGRE